MTAGLFITGAGTGIGKTLVTCALAAQMRAMGARPLALKPVASGVDPEDLAGSDPGQILAAMGEAVTPEAVAAGTPWLYEAPLAPNMAAARAGVRISFDEVTAFCRARMQEAGRPVLIEGVGGVMAPVSDDRLVVDWIEALKLPAVLVGGAYLGTISHVLSAAEVLRRRGLQLAGVVISDQGDGPVPLDELIATLDRFLPGVPMAGFGPQGPGPEPWRRVPPLTHLLAVPSGPTM